MGIQTINNYASTLAADLAALATSCTVATGDGAALSGASASNPYHLTLESGGKLEVVEVTAAAGDVLTIVRGREGTADQAWLTGMPIEARVTSAILDQGGSAGLIDHGSITTALTLNATDARAHKLFIGASLTLTLQSGLDASKFWEIHLLLDGSGATITTMPNVTWVLGEDGLARDAPFAFSPGKGTAEKYVVTFVTYDGGTTWYGNWKQD